MKWNTPFKLISVGAILLSVVQPAVANGYVLPYPSFMPGNKLYKVSQVFDIVGNYWNWGSIAQAKYHLALADKYLVESKTLFEYNQYLLAVKALNHSNGEVQKVLPFINNGTKEGKDMSLLRTIFSSALDKHIEVLGFLKTIVPKTYTWQPEKATATDLHIFDDIESSILLREGLK
jgi:hypothetical protein